MVVNSFINSFGVRLTSNGLKKLYQYAVRRALYQIMTIMIIRTITIGGVGLIIGTITIGGVGLAKMESWTEEVEIWDWRVGEEHVYRDSKLPCCVSLFFLTLDLL